jgi:hypothetical protein
MRRFLLILFVLVLPLRAVAGDLMVLAMATSPHGMPATTAAAMAPDCEMHRAAAARRSPRRRTASRRRTIAARSACRWTQSGAVSCSASTSPSRVAAASEASFLSAALSRSLRPPSL